MNDNLISQEERGSALVMTLIILTMGLTISLSVSAIFLNQLNLSKQIEITLQSFAAADSGIEEALYQDRVALAILWTPEEINNFNFQGVLMNQSKQYANYVYCISSGNIYSGNNFSACNSPAYQYNFNRGAGVTAITATGSYKGVKRILKVFY